MLKITRNSINIELTLCYLLLFLYIVGGNALTVNFGVRLPIKLAEIASIPYIIIVFCKHTDFCIRIRIFKHEMFILFWLLMGTVSALFNALIYQYQLSELFYGIFYSIRIMHLILVTHIMVLTFHKNCIHVADVISFVLTLYVIVCILGFIQLILFPFANNFYQLFYDYGFYFPNADPHVGRLLSTYFDPNYLSSCLVIPFTLSLYPLIYNRDTITKRDIIMLLLFTLTIVLTVSRSGFLGMAVVCILPIMHRKINNKELKYLILFLGIVVITLIYIYFRESEGGAIIACN